jgi:mycothiol synthase
VTKLPAGYLLRHPREDELSAVQALFDAAESADCGEPRVSDFDVVASARDPRRDYPRNGWVVEAPGGELAAFGGVQWMPPGSGDSRQVVHPDHRGRGLGEALIDVIGRRAAQLAAQAPPEAPATLTVWCEDIKTQRRAALVARGYAKVRESFIMRIDLGPDYEAARMPDGFSIRTFRPDRDELAVYQASEEAFADDFHHDYATYEQWRAYAVDHRWFRPDLWFIAWRGQQIAGECLVLHGDDEWLVDSLSVRRPWRQRGLATGLLTRGLAAARDGGAEVVRLEVDAQNPTGALAVYQAVGMRVERRFEVFEKRLTSTGEPAAPRR